MHQLSKEADDLGFWVQSELVINGTQGRLQYDLQNAFVWSPEGACRAPQSGAVCKKVQGNEELPAACVGQVTQTLSWDLEYEGQPLSQIALQTLDICIGKKSYNVHLEGLRQK